MNKRTQPAIRIGVGGWTYEPWRGVFYPAGLPHKNELRYASGKLTSIEINGTFYGRQKPETFAKWYDETPDDFVFSLKAPRFATHRKVLADAGESIDAFLSSGVAALRHKLGPINWQFAPNKSFDADDFARFVALLPREVAGNPLRHAVEVRHDSFQNEHFVMLAREHGVAIVVARDAPYPQIADVTAPFVYARIMGTVETEPRGYCDDALDRWATRVRVWASGGAPSDLPLLVEHETAAAGRDVFLYVIGGFKAHNPAAAMALIERGSDAPRAA
jgi:uncharacterized protein YecE (DUF72 family)